MRKSIAAATVAVTGLGALGLGTAIAGADDGAPDGDRSDWVQDALGGLVEDGTIDQGQADAVEEALEDAHAGHRDAHHGHDGGVDGDGDDHEGHHGFGFGVPWFGPGIGEPSALADSLGIDVEELVDELRDGRSVGEVAEELGVDVDGLVDDLLAALGERLDEAVADDHLSQEEADEALSGAEERITAFVNGEMPEPPDLPGSPDHGGPGRHWSHD